MIETLDHPMSPERVGWKFARLKTLHDAGVTVPRFFCLPDSVFRSAVAPVADEVTALLRTVDFDDWSAVTAASGRIAEVMHGVDVPIDAVLAAFDATFSVDALVSVRSSVVASDMSQAEDSADNPFAGMSDSFLYVRRDGLRDAIVACWASAFSAEGLLYRHRLGMTLDGLGVAVGVQDMVFGERSLVLFTCDPTSYANDAVITAGWGIGEGVVQEVADVDHYFLRSRNDEVERVVSTKTRMITFDAAVGHGSTTAAVPADRADAAVLSDDDVHAVAAVGRRIENLFGAPQDIEATLTPDGVLHVLQSRPIALDRERHRIWSSANVSESFPGTTTPMTYSVARRFYWLLNYDYLRRSGVSESDLHDLHETMTRLLGYIDGRIYHNITSFIRMLAVLPVFEDYRKDWERLVAELDSYYSHEEQAPAGLWARAKRTASLVRSYGVGTLNFARLDRDFATFENEWAVLIAAKRDIDLDTRHPLTLVADYRQVWETAGRIWGTTLINYQYMVLSQKLIEHALDRWDVPDRDTLFARLLCGGRQLRGAEIALSAVHLAEQVRADPELAALFTSEQPRDVWDRLAAGELPHDFTAGVRKHLDRFGDRGLQELKLERPNLRDTPWELLKVVAQYAATEHTAAALDEVERASRLDGEAQLRTALPDHPVRRRILLQLFDQLRRFLYYREAGRYMRSELFGYSKQVIAAIGRQLTDRGVLVDPQDVFYLDIDELFGYVDGSGSTRDLGALVDVRRRDLERAEKLTRLREFATGDIVGTGAPSALDDAGDSGATLLRGLGSCAGTVRGRARVVDDPSLGGDVDADSILVARETDPGWLFLMLACRGIVVERGSMLSHTAITGRKFGIPTIVGVPDATTRIPDGALVEIDGATGRVTLLEDADMIV